MGSEKRNSDIIWGWLWVSFAWMALLTILSAIPGKAMPHWDVLSYDKVVHVCFYAPLGWSIISSLVRKVDFRFGVMMMVVMLFGGIDEIHQHFVPGRTMDVWDWVADSIGGIIGGTFFLLWEHYWNKRSVKIT